MDEGISLTKKISHAEIYSYLVRCIPAITNIHFKDLSIELRGQNEPVRLFGTAWVKGQEREFDYVLMRDGTVVFADQFIEEIYRMVPSLRNIGITFMMITINPKDIVSAHLFIEIHADLTTGFLHTYQLASID